MPASVARKISMSRQCRIFAQGTNLLTWIELKPLTLNLTLEQELIRFQGNFNFGPEVNF